MDNTWTLALAEWFVETRSWWLVAFIGWSLGLYKGLFLGAVSHRQYYDKSNQGH